MKPIKPLINSLTKDQIIELVAKIPDIKQFVYGQCSDFPQFAEDLYQDLFLHLMKFDDTDLRGIYLRGELHAIIISFIQLQIQGDRTPFKNIYVQPSRYRPFGEDSDEDQSIEELALTIQSIRDNKLDQGEEFIHSALELLPEHMRLLHFSHEYGERIYRRFNNS